MGAKQPGTGKPKIDRTMCTRTLGMVRTRLRSVFAAAVADQRIYTNPVEATKRIKGNDADDEDKRSGVALSFEEAARLYELGSILYEAGVCRLWGAIFTGASIGLRRGEIMGLRWQDINFETDTLSVRKNLTLVDSKVTLGKLKTPKSLRDIPIPPSLRIVLEQQQQAMQHEANIRGETLHPDSPVFATVIGESTSPDNLGRALSSLLEWSDTNQPMTERRSTNLAKPRAITTQLGTLERRLKAVPVLYRAKLAVAIKNGQALPRITPHDLRHTAGTHMIQRGMAYPEVSKVMGHSKVSITIDIYLHISNADVKAKMIDLYSTTPARAVASTPIN